MGAVCTSAAGHHFHSPAQRPPGPHLDEHPHIRFSTVCSASCSSCPFRPGACSASAADSRCLLSSRRSGGSPRRSGVSDSATPMSVAVIHEAGCVSLRRVLCPSTFTFPLETGPKESLDSGCPAKEVRGRRVQFASKTGRNSSPHRRQDIFCPCVIVTVTSIRGKAAHHTQGHSNCPVLLKPVIELLHEHIPARHILSLQLKQSKHLTVLLIGCRALGDTCVTPLSFPQSDSDMHARRLRSTCRRGRPACSIIFHLGGAHYAQRFGPWL